MNDDNRANHTEKTLEKTKSMLDELENPLEDNKGSDEISQLIPVPDISHPIVKKKQRPSPSLKRVHSFWIQKLYSIFVISFIIHVNYIKYILKDNREYEFYCFLGGKDSNLNSKL